VKEIFFLALAMLAFSLVPAHADPLPSDYIGCHEPTGIHDKESAYNPSQVGAERFQYDEKCS
jgi:hypothetical protein